MNRKLKFPLIYIVFIVLASYSFAEVDLTELVKNIHPAVATFITYDQNKKPLGQGSGFFIDAHGHFITNYHVLEGASHAEVRTYDGKRYPINSVIGENKKMDLIKVLVDIPWSSVQWINATGALPSIAERVIVIGSPMGLDLTVSEGIVSSVREIPDLGKILQISAAISSGSSGSPVVNMKGQVVGIVSFYLIKGQNLNFAIPAKYLLDLKPSKTIKTISEWTHGGKRYHVVQPGKTLTKRLYESEFGFSIELSSQWTIRSRQELKENQDLLEPMLENLKKTVLRKADKNTIEKFMISMKSGGIEFYIQQDHPGVNINAQKMFGRVPQTHAELEVFCKMLPDSIAKHWGISIKVNKCEQRNVGGLTTTYVVYETLGTGAKLINCQIPKSPNVIITITAFSGNQYFEIIEYEFDEIMESFELKKTGD